MAKFTVYVPDELWDRTRAIGADQNPSQLVQDALRVYVTEKTPKPVFARRRPDGAEHKVSQLVPRLAKEAETAYHEGYREGLEYAAECPWLELEYLAQCNWSPREALRGSDIEASSLFGYFRKKVANAAEVERLFGPQAVFPLWSGAEMTGFMDALRTVWDTARAFQPQASEASGEPEEARSASRRSPEKVSGATRSVRSWAVPFSSTQNNRNWSRRGPCARTS